MMVKLVVHIGHGKTGSSSIQRSLLEATKQLELQGIKYLGLMLEHARNASRPVWQVRTGSDRFFDQTIATQANQELSTVLEEELKQLTDQGVATAIWSNEWLLERPNHTLPALKGLRDKGFEIEFQCYVRRHDKWAQSAYTQWGLKHKSYTGPILDFPDWLMVFGERQFQFSPSLSIWDEAFGDRLSVFNFDSAGDVVQHFLQANGIFNIPSLNENVSADPIFVAAQTVFNSRKAAPVLPLAFETILKTTERGDENRVFLPTLDKLMPTTEILERLVKDRAEDISQINTLLIRSGEPPLSFETPPKKVQHPTPWEMDQFILKLLFAYAEEAGVMRGQIAALQQQLTALKNNGT